MIKLHNLVLLVTLLVTSNTYSQEHAQIIYDNTVYAIDDKNQLTITQDYKVKINSKEGLKYSYFVDYIDKYKKLKKLEVILKDKNDKKIKSFNKGDGHEYGFNSNYEIDDSKIFALDPDYQNYPFIIEVSSISEQSDYLGLPTWIPRSSFNVSVESAQLKVIFPSNKKINFLEENISSESSVDDGSEKTVTYHITNLESIDSKLRYRDFYKDQPKVLLTPEEFEIEKVQGSYRSWNEFGEWFLELNSDPYILTEETKQYIDRLEKKDAKQVIRELYHYMQDRTRYVSIQLGIGGFKSIPTEFVDSKGYGDCKALTTYMKNMLDYAGIKSNYILVKAGRDVPDVNEAFPSNQFNHVYLGIPLSDTLYLECTSQISPTYFTGTFTDDRNVLWIEKNNSQIIRSKQYDISSNIQKNIAELKIDDNGTGQLNLKTTNQGIFLEQLFFYKNAQNDRVKSFQNSEFDYKDFVVDSYTMDHEDRDAEKMDVNLDITINNFAQKLGDNLIIPKVPLRPIDNYIDESQLFHYASVPRAIHVNDTVRISFQQKHFINKHDNQVTINSEFGSYSQNVIEDGDGIICIRSFELVKGDYTKDDYTKFNEFWSKVKKAERKKIVLTTKT